MNIARSNRKDSDQKSLFQKWKSYVDYRQFRVEPFILLYMIGFSLSGMSVSQLVQDKLCRVDYDQSSTFCVSINSPDFDHGAETIKSNIITDGTYITVYRTLLSTLPCILWAVFLGPWSDNYVNGRKYIMIMGAGAAAFESIILIINACDFFSSAYFVLLSFIPSALSGGIIATLMAVYAYCSATSDKMTRSTRFTVVEICFWMAQPIGSFIGGQVLGNGNENNEYQLYNYIPVFVISFCCHIAAVIWAIMVIDEQNSPTIEDDRTFFNEDDLASSYEPLPIPQQLRASINSDPIQDSYAEGSNNNENGIENSTDAFNLSYISLNKISDWSWAFLKQFRDLFDFNHVRNLCTTLTRKRSHWGRGQIWILFASTAFLLLVYLNTTFILWSYVEKLYSWPPKFYSNVTSTVAIVTLIFMGLVFQVFVVVLKFSDMVISLIGVLSLMGQCILRGSWQHQMGLYLSFFIGTLAPLSLIGIRSRLSKIIENDERGKLFALLAIVEALTPGIASLFYTVIFSSSIDVYPGLVFQLAAFILLIPLMAIIFIDVYCLHDYDQPQA